MKRFVGMTFAIIVVAEVASAQGGSTVGPAAWQKDPVEFARLLMGDDLSLRPSAEAMTSLPVPDSVRQAVIGSGVSWRLFRRNNPLGSGPTTLASVGIAQGDQTTGVLLVLARRAVGDTEICDAPYRDLPIDGPIQIEGKVSSFLAGIRPDGNRVIVVEMTGVPGCSASTSTTPDLSGGWSHERRGGRTNGVPKGSVELTRDASCDQDGFTCFKGSSQYELKKGETKGDPQVWVVGLKGSQIAIVMGLATLTCAGPLQGTDKIIAECSFLGQASIGTLTLTRAKLP